MDSLSPSRLLLKPWQDRSILGIQKIATPGEQATHIDRILRDLVATHGAVAFFDPPANGTFTRIVGAIECFSLGPFPGPVACQAMPEIPAVQNHESEPRGQTEVLAVLRWCSLQIASMQRFQFSGLLFLPALDQFASAR
jgi:hypothetical protein